MEKSHRRVVLSPHLDDAAFSAWHALTSQEGTIVVTVFAGVPEPGFVTPLDRMHGARESGRWMERRRSEDRAALGLAGCRVVHLDLLDGQYRMYQVPELRTAMEREPGRLIELAASSSRARTEPELIAAELRRHVDAGTDVYAPAGIGGHSDHQDVARAAVLLGHCVGSLRLYADSPYYLRDGLPGWFDSPDAPETDMDAAVARLCADAGTAVHPVRFPVRLPSEAMRRKFQAMQAYATEFAAVNEDFGGIAGDLSVMSHETYWRLW